VGRARAAKTQTLSGGHLHLLETAAVRYLATRSAKDPSLDQILTPFGSAALTIDEIAQSRCGVWSSHPV